MYPLGTYFLVRRSSHFLRKLTRFMSFCEHLSSTVNTKQCQFIFGKTIYVPLILEIV